MNKDRTPTIDEKLKLNMQRRAEKIASLGIRMHACTPTEFGELSVRLYEMLDVLQLQLEVL